MGSRPLALRRLSCPRCADGDDLTRASIRLDAEGYLYIQMRCTLCTAIWQLRVHVGLTTTETVQEPPGEEVLRPSPEVSDAEVDEALREAGYGNVQWPDGVEPSRDGGA